MKGIEGIPNGTLAKYVFPVDDPAWNELDARIDATHRRLTLSCYSWPGLDPLSSMQRYGRQLEPLLDVIFDKPVDAMGSGKRFVVRTSHGEGGGDEMERTSHTLTFGFPRMHKEVGERRDFLPPLIHAIAGLGCPVLVETGIGSGMGYVDEDYVRDRRRRCRGMSARPTSKTSSSCSALPSKGSSICVREPRCCRCCTSPRVRPGSHIWSE